MGVSRILSTRRAGFTLLELLVVLVLISVVFGIALTGFSFGRSRLSSAAYDLTRTVQGLYSETIRSGKIHRLTFFDRGKRFEIQSFQLPKPKPPETDREALDKWEEEQEALEEALRDIPLAQRKRTDRGSFTRVKEGALSSSISIKSLYIGQQEMEWPEPNNDAPPQGLSILFYPSGEVDQAMIVLKEGDVDGDGRTLSLIIEPMSARVTTRQGEVTKEDWIRHFGEQKK